MTCRHSILHRRAFASKINSHSHHSSTTSSNDSKKDDDLWLSDAMPEVEGKVGMYVCGITGYDLSHMGHACVYGIAAAEELCSLTEDEVLQKMEERNDTRKNKEYEKSDVSRKDLAAVGITIMDSPDSTSWRPAIPLGLWPCKKNLIKVLEIHNRGYKFTF